MKRRLIAVLVLLLLLLPVYATAGQVVDHISVLTGSVMAQGLAAPGQLVRQGDVIIMVNTIVGPAPAARANVNGRVVEVLVKPGDVIRVGQIVARIEAQ